MKLCTMKYTLVGPLFALLSLLVINGKSQENNTIHQTFDENVTSISLSNSRAGEATKQRKTFAPESNLVISVIDLPPNISFFILQVHTYQYNVTLSYDKLNLNKASNRSIFGSNIGLFLKPNAKEPIEFFLKNENVRDVEALLAVVPYSDQVPIPGGCNMEFNIEVAPYQKLLVNDAIVTVDSQPASLPATNSKAEKSCEKHSIQPETYRIYLTSRDFSVESYFNAIGSMLTVADILRNGEKISPPATASQLRRFYSSYPGTGAVYAAVAQSGTFSSAYVPTFSYGCNYALYPDDCLFLNTSLSIGMCYLAICVGCVCIFFGHVCDYVESFTFTTCFGAAIGYIATKRIISDDTTHVGVSIIIAFFVLLAVGLTSFRTKANQGRTVSIFSFGFLCSSLAYYCVKGAPAILENGWTFWSIYLCIALIFIIAIIVTQLFAEFVMCAVLGGFLLTISIDSFTGSSLKYIVVNVIRRITVPEFNYAVISVPWQGPEKGFIALWVILALVRIARQYCTHMCSCFCGTSEDGGNPDMNYETLGDHPESTNWNSRKKFREKWQRRP